MKLAFSGEVFSHGCTLAWTLEKVREYGIPYFELWAGNCPQLGGDCHIRLYRDRDIAATKRAFQTAGVEVACVAFGGAFHEEIVADASLYSRELTRAVEVAAELGAGYVNHYLTKIAPMAEPDFPVLEEYLAAALRRGEELGVTLVLENEAVDATHTPEKMQAILRHFGSARFKTNFDATNYYQGGNEAFPYAYETLREQIQYVHIKNGCVYVPSHGHEEEWLGGPITAGAPGRRIVYTPPFAGGVNILGLLERLKADDYQGYFVLEPHSGVENVLRYYDAALPRLQELGYFQPQT